MRTRIATTALTAALSALLIAGPAHAITITEQTTPDANSNPIGIAAATDGGLYFAESGVRQIAELMPNGSFSAFPLSAADASPQHATRAADGSVWVTDASSSGIVHHVALGGAVTDVPVPTVAATGGIATGADNNIWYTVPSSNRVGHIDPATAAALDVALPATGDNRPAGIAPGSDSAMWVTAPGTNSILRVELSGTDIRSYALPTANADPEGITPGPDGALWFTERSAGKIGRITTAGAITEFAVGGAPTAITTGPDGALWFTVQGATAAIGRLTVAGEPTVYPLPAGGGAPADLTTGPGAVGAVIAYTRAPATIGRVTVPPLPVVGRSADAEVVSGTVTVRVPGSGRFTKLTADAQSLPVGSELDTTAGKVRLTAAAGTGTRVTKTSVFYDGRFRIAQSRARDAVFQVALSGPLAGCGRGHAARAQATAAASRKRRGRGLWGDGKGTFETTGKHSAATVRGTRWLVEDRCDGTTRTTVARGVVAVRDFTRRRTVTVRAGHSYTARPRR